MKKFVYALATIVTVLTGAAPGQAAPVIWNASPDAASSVVNCCWTNISSSQNFAEVVNFSSGAAVGGMDIYMPLGYATLGQTAVIRLYANAGTAPGSLISQFTEAVSAIDTLGTASQSSLRRIHVDFTNALNLMAGASYWIGMSPQSGGWTQTGLAGISGGNGKMAQFSGTTYQHQPSIGDMAFRLYSFDVPAPSALALFGLGLFAAGALRRDRR